MSTVDARWFKSSYSGSGQGSDCVEVAWLKSSYSTSGNNSNCVEVASGAPVAVRDSKAPDAGNLQVSAAAWSAFLTKSGDR
ncbi:Uncharacterised protein [Amycolatopsis camponoti]|uniref:DUF397 domain-containing protein n=1 Tax=Amycolatopsis camponoti TaxID=2606593 RepID=A0A6I8M522_9PSEU|nr:DUF397 domain-containing protein [Amycolatopsis camponoti]VVJ22774.1 Uncharacterised protein [Amycolatopsis camponoti]